MSKKEQEWYIGDRARKSNPSVLFLELLKAGYAIVDGFIMHKRDQGMIEAIKEEKPEVVITGRVHATYIKQ